MSQFAKINYPTCPECGTLLNDLRIFDLWMLELQAHFHEKQCLKCGKPFLMKARAELTVEVVPVDTEGDAV